MSRARFSFYSCGCIALFLLSSCATAPKPGEYSSRDLMEAACPAGFANESAPKTVKGSIWVKVESKQMSGQFPASVLVQYPKSLGVEVTNLIGAPQAWLKIENGKSELRFTAENEKEYGKPSTRTMFGGLPIEVAPRLFAGGVPCPIDSKSQEIRIQQQSDGGLRVTATQVKTKASTHYVYRFMTYAGRPWVAEARWTHQGQEITFIREEPMDPDNAPKKWSASSPSGTIQVRWKDRTISSGQ